MNKDATASSIASVELSGVIIRKDGTREDLGVMTRWDRSPFRRFKFRFTQWLRGKPAGRVHFSEL